MSIFKNLYNILYYIILIKKKIEFIKYNMTFEDILYIVQVQKLMYLNIENLNQFCLIL